MSSTTPTPRDGAVGALVRQDGTVVLAHVRVAARPLSRARGLLGVRTLPPDAGLWIRPCRSVHTFGMRMPIACLFLDGEGRVVQVVSSLRPWRLASARGATGVVEAAPGTFDGLAPGERVRFIAEHG